MKGFNDIVEKMKNGSWIPPVAKLIGFEMTNCKEGRATFNMHADQRHHNPMGTLHGGIMTDILDAAMGMAFASTLKENELFTTINLQVNFLSSVIEDDLEAEAEVIKRGRSVGFVEAKLHNKAGTLIATAQSACKVLKMNKNTKEQITS